MYLLAHNVSPRPITFEGYTLAPGEEASIPNLDLATFHDLAKHSPEVRAVLDSGALVVREPDATEAYERAPRNPDGTVTVYASEPVDLAALLAPFEKEPAS